jgi:hypothetical protein
VFVVLHGRLDTEVQRIYCGDQTTPAHKIVLTNNSSDYLRSLPSHGIMGEVSLRTDAPSQEDLESSFTDSLLKMKLVQSRSDIKAVSSMTVRYGYPVATINSDSIIAQLKDWLLQREIYNTGRFAEWAYINSDEAIFRAIALGRELSNDGFSKIKSKKPDISMLR